MLGKASSPNLCSSAAHDPSAQPAQPGSCKQVLASAPAEERVKNHSQPKSTSQKPWGALACVVRVQRTEQSWRAWKARTALLSILKVLPQKELRDWGTTSFSYCRGVKSWISLAEIWAVFLHVLSWATSLQTYTFPIRLHCPLGTYKMSVI